MARAYGAARRGLDVAAQSGGIGEVAQFESIFRLCYLRGPAGTIVALAEEIS